jgi:hypothetical protein
MPSEEDMTTQLAYTIRQREFDYLQLHWLEKTTGRPSHEWDLYIVKELFDNALDADEQWGREHSGAVELTVDLHYRDIDVLDIHSLDVAVFNRAPFPTGLLPAIFDLTAYTSDKSHYNYPSRGQQGNALKTLLGIPYALRHFGYGDYANIHKPLVIETGDQSYIISLEIDEAHQQARLSSIRPTPLNPPHDGTCIRVGIDRFVQEQPRTLADLHAWAQRFALLNPHATFHWRARIGDQEASWDFATDPTWHDLFADTAPVCWYEYTQLRELLLALERELGPKTPLPQVLQAFAGFTPVEDADGQRAKALCNRQGFQTLGDLRLTSDHVHTLRDTLWSALRREGRKVPAEQLGGLGERYAVGALTRFFDLETVPLYRRITHDDVADPAHPFVLELALARLPPGRKRVIWTGLNHTPTYEDPFYTRWLYPPVFDGEPVFGLDGFLDAYGQTADQPVLLVMHLICPNLAYQDFSKTVIETRPFREPLAEALHEMLTAFGTVQTEQVEDLQPLVRGLMPQAMCLLSPDGQQRFAAPQLLRAVRHLLAERLRDEGRAELAETWLDDPGADARLQGYIQAYARDHPEAMVNLIQPQRGRLSLPVHPDGHTTLALSHVDRRVLDEACINKMLLVTDPEMEAVIVANGLLARFDIALLRIEGTLDASFEALLPHLDRLRLPLALLHHATPSDCLLAERLRARLDEAKLAHISLYDLGLTPAQGRNLDLPAEPGPGGGDRAALARHLDADEVTFLMDRSQQMSLFSMTVDGLIAWLEKRFEALGLAPKLIPDDDHLRATALTAMKQVLTDCVLDRFCEVAHADFLADQVIQALSSDLSVDDLHLQLRESIGRRSLQAWRTIWSDLIMKRCQEILASRQEQISQLISAHKRSLTATSDSTGRR